MTIKRRLLTQVVPCFTIREKQQQRITPRLLTANFGWIKSAKFFFFFFFQHLESNQHWDGCRWTQLGNTSISLPGAQPLIQPSPRHSFNIFCYFIAGFRLRKSLNTSFKSYKINFGDIRQRLVNSTSNAGNRTRRRPRSLSFLVVFVRQTILQNRLWSWNASAVGVNTNSDPWQV